MSEIRMQEVLLVGRIQGEPKKTGNECYFRLGAEEGQEPFPCLCNEKTAENMSKYLHNGDEISIEGKLMWRKFANEDKPMLIIYARYISYGRKARTLQPPGSLG